MIKNKKKLFKILIITSLILIIAMVIFSNIPVKAALDPITNPGGYDLSKGVSYDTQIISKKIGPILGWLNILGIIFSVIAIAIIGLKYMTSSVEAKADLKKSILGYVIGVALIATVTTIPNFIYNITTTVFKEENKESSIKMVCNLEKEINVHEYKI